MDLRWLAMWVGGPVLIAVLIIVVLTRRRSSRAELSRLETWCVGLIGTGSLLALIGAVAALFFATSVFSSDPTIVRGFDLGNAENPGFTDKSDLIVDAGYETVWLSVSTLPAGTRWLIYAETILPALATIAICVTVFWLSFMLLRGRPFVRSLVHAVRATAIVVVVAGVGTQVFASAARSSIVQYLDPFTITAGGNADDPSYEGLMGWMLNLDLAPIGWALGLALVAAAFELGQRLQRDTEGLV